MVRNVHETDTSNASEEAVSNPKHNHCERDVSWTNIGSAKRGLFGYQRRKQSSVQCHNSLVNAYITCWHGCIIKWNFLCTFLDILCSANQQAWRKANQDRVGRWTRICDAVPYQTWRKLHVPIQDPRTRRHAMVARTQFMAKSNSLWSHYHSS